MTDGDSNNGEGNEVLCDVSLAEGPIKSIKFISVGKSGTAGNDLAIGEGGNIFGDDSEPISFNVVVDGFNATIKGNADIAATVANDYTSSARTTTGDASASSTTSGRNGQGEVIAIDANAVTVKGTGIIAGSVDNSQSTSAKTTTGRAEAESQDGLVRGVRANDLLIKETATITGDVKTDVAAKAVTHGGGDAEASANSFNPDAKNSAFGGESVGVDIETIVAKEALNVIGKVESKFDVDAKNHHGNASASSAELQVTGVLITEAKGADVDIDGSATVEQDVFAKTVGGGNAEATITSGPDFKKSVSPKLDGITGIASTSGINAKGTLNVDGVVDYDGTAVAKNTTGNAKAQVGTDDLPLQDMVGTLLVTSGPTSGPKSGSGGLHVSGISTADTVAKATTHSGKAVASVDSDPVKGVKSNPGTLYKSKGDLTVDGDAKFTADVDSRSTGSSGSGGKSSASADVANVVGVDLSQLDSAPRETVPANELKAAGHVDVDGHVDTTLNAQAVNTTGRSIASTTTTLQKGVLISDNDNSFPPSSDPSTVVRGSSVDIDGGVTSTSIAKAVSHGGGGAFASADAVSENVNRRGKATEAFGGETVGVDVDKVVSKSDLDVTGVVESTYDVDALNTHGKAIASSAALQATGVLNNVAKGADVDIDGSATVEQDVFAKTVGGGNAKSTITSGPDFKNSVDIKLDGITGIASTSGINAKGTLNVDGVVDYDGTAVAKNTTGNAKARVGTDDLPLQDMVGTLLVNSGPKSGSDMHISGDTTADTVAKATTHSGKAVASVDSDPVKGVKSNPGTLYKSKGDLTVDGDAKFTADVDSRSTGSSGSGGKSSASADVANVVGVDLSQLDSAPRETVPANELKAAGHVDVDGHVDTTLNAQAVNTTGRSIASTTTTLQKGVLISDNDNSFPPSSDPSTVVRGSSVDIDGGVTSTSIAKAVSHGGGGAFASADAVSENVNRRGKATEAFGGETVGVDVDKVVSKSDLDVTGVVESTYDVDALNTHGKAIASSAALQATGVLNNVAKGADVDIDGSATVEQDVFAKTVGGGNAKSTITSGPDFKNSVDIKLDGITGIASTSGINAKGTLNVDGVVDYDGTAVAKNTTGNAKARVGTDDLPLQDMVGTLLVNSGPKSGSDMHISGDTTADTVAKATTHSGKAVASVDSDPVKGVKSNPGTLYKSKGDLTVDGDAKFTADVDSRSTGSSGSGGKSSASADVANVVGVDLSQLDSAPRETVPANELKAAGHVDVDGHVDTTLNAQAVNTTGRSIASTTTTLQKGVLISDNAAGGPPSNPSQYSIARLEVAPGYGEGSPNETSSPSTVVRGSSVDIDGGVTSTSTAKAVSHGGGGAFASADAVSENVNRRGKATEAFGGETVGVDVDKVVSKSDLDVTGVVESTYDVDALNTHGKAIASSAALQATGVLNNVAKGADVDIDGSATVEQDVFAKTVGGGNAKSTITSGPDFKNSVDIKLDGITGIASTSGINAKGTLNVDGVVDYEGTAVAKNTTGNAKAQVGTNDLPLQDMVGTLLVNSGPRSGGDMYISGDSTAELVADAKTGTGSAKALVNADPVKGVKGNPGVLFRANGDLHVNATADINAQANSFAVGGSGERSAANVQTTNVIGFDLSPLDSARSISNPARAKAKADIHLDGVASTYLASDSEITTGNASAAVASELVVGINAQSILSRGSGTISGSAINVSTASSATTTGKKSEASVFNDETSGISLLSSNDIAIKGGGSVEGDGFVSGYSDAYAVTGNATSGAQMSANGIELGYDSKLMIKGEGDVTGKGYVGEPIYDYEDYLVLSPFIISSETTTGNSVSTSDFSASGISGDDFSSIKVSSGDVKGTGAAIINTTSSTHHGDTSSATSDLSIFGIKNVDSIANSSTGVVEGRALGIAETEALNVTGDAHARSTISAIGIDATDIHSSGEINGVATISQTVTAKTVTGSASAHAISGPIIGINSSTINSRGDLTITATASLDTVAYSESI